MLLQIFSVFDTKARAYLPPFFLPTIQMAERTFSDCANDINHAFGRHPDDYILFHLGAFDDAKGDFSILSLNANLGSARNFYIPNSEVIANEVDDNTSI